MFTAPGAPKSLKYNNIRTATLGQHNPKKLTRKKQDQNHRHTQRYIHITRYVRTMLLKHRGMIIMIGLIFFIIQLVWK